MTITKSKIYKSQEPHSEVPTKDFVSLGHRILDRLGNENTNRVIFVDTASGRQWTGAQLKDKILNIATALVDEHKFVPSTVVCISYDNSDLSCILSLAIICAGGVVACAFPKDPYAEMLYLARKVRPKFLFCHQRIVHLGEQLEVDMGYEMVVISMDEQLRPDSQNPVKQFEHYLNYDHKQSKSLNQIPVACKDIYRDVAFITMSSGTTGQPKAVPVTHFNCFADLMNLFTRRAQNIKFGCSASLDYVSGRLIILGAVETGYTAIIVNNSEPKSYLETIDNYKINAIYLGAAALYNLITYKELDNYDISSLRLIFPMGAKIIYLDELRDFLTKHPHINFMKQGYGSSETSGVATKSMTPEEYLQDCHNCGKLHPGVEAKIVDTVTGELLGANQKGILHIKGFSLFPGYYDVEQSKGNMYNVDAKEQQLDKNANIGISNSFVRDSTIFDDDGFYITGDIAYFSSQEDLYIVGRQKELMSCRGAKKVLPQELEEILSEHPAVSEVCVVGIPNKIELTLHCPRAFIVLKPNYYIGGDENELNRPSEGKNDDVTTCLHRPELLEHKGNHKLSKLSARPRRKISENIMKFSNERVGWEKQLTGGIVILDEIPTLRATGKTNKKYLRSLSLDQVEIYGDRSG